MGNENVDVARADMAIDLTMVNLVAAGVIKSSPDFEARVFAGVAYLNLDRDLDVSYQNFDAVSETDVSRGLELTGYGLRAGSSVTFEFWERFRLHGRLAAELHKADQDLVLTEEDFSDGEFDGVNVKVADEISSVVPVLETAISLSYLFQLGDVTSVEAGIGYEFTNIFNVLDTRFTDNALESALTDDRRSIGFNGWSVFLKAKF